MQTDNEIPILLIRAFEKHLMVWYHHLIQPQLQTAERFWLPSAIVLPIVKLIPLDI